MGDDYPSEEKIQELLLDTGMSPSVLGFQYATYALQLVIADEEYLHNITKKLYVDIAKKYHVTKISVERNIRHAITRAWNYGDMIFNEKLFRNSINPNTGVPTNSQFFARLYFYLCNHYTGKSA